MGRIPPPAARNWSSAARSHHEIRVPPLARIAWIAEYARAIRDASGAVVRYEGTFEDITARKTAEEALQRARDELEDRVRDRTAELAMLNGTLRQLDDTLRSLLIDRIYDTYIDEEQLQDCDHTILEIANALEPKPYSSRAFIREMGKYLVEHGKKDNSLVKLAYEHDVPIFCPAFVDSSAGFGLVKHQVDAAKAGKPYMVLDAIADFRELTDIKIKAGTTGLLMIGGGVPKNFIQDTVVCAEILGHDDVQVHKYAVQITVADVRDGACSSSTLQEAASWGKVNTGIEQMVFAEAGSVMPLLASDAYHRGHWKDRAKRAWGKMFAD